MDDNRKFWERVAKIYTPLQGKSNGKTYQYIAEKCEKYITEQSAVLEIACGTGQFTLPLCGGAGIWEATDFSEKMVRETRKRCPSSVKVSVQDATHLTYEDSSFDVVLIGNALHIMPYPEKALLEARRVLRTGGMMIAPTFVYEGTTNSFRIWISEKAGFRTYNKWDMEGLKEFIGTSGFRIIEEEIIPASPIPEGFIAAEKI